MMISSPVQYASFRKIAPSQVDMWTKVAFADALLKAGTRWATSLLRIMSRSLVTLPTNWSLSAQDLWARVKEMDSADGAFASSVNVSYYVKAKETDAHSTRLVMFSSHNDGALIKLAKRCGFPRGCEVVWNVATEKVHLRGFYPKIL